MVERLLNAGGSAKALGQNMRAWKTCSEKAAFTYYKRLRPPPPHNTALHPTSKRNSCTTIHYTYVFKYMYCKVFIKRKVQKY